MRSKINFLFPIISFLLLFPSGLKARDLNEYWYGIGIGTSELLCSLKNNGVISSNYMNEYLKDYILKLRTLDNNLVKVDKFKAGVTHINSFYPSCNLRS